MDVNGGLGNHEQLLCTNHTEVDSPSPTLAKGKIIFESDFSSYLHDCSQVGPVYPVVLQSHVLEPSKLAVHTPLFLQ